MPTAGAVVRRPPLCPTDAAHYLFALADTEPMRIEDRAACVKRMRLVVKWVNRNRSDYLRNLFYAQKERARDVKKQKGGRTKH